jgi:hypothetical protein
VNALTQLKLQKVHSSIAAVVKGLRTGGASAELSLKTLYI